MDKKVGVKLSKMRFLYYGLGILMGCFVLWISLNEGKRLHYLRYLQGRTVPLPLLLLF